MTQIDRVSFCKAYVPMAKAGKSALEIGKALGVDKLEGKDTDAKVAQFVSQKASNYRRELREAATKFAKRDKLDQEATDALVKAASDKLPKLSTRTQVVEDFSAFLDELIAECDTPLDEGEGAENAETPS